MSASRRTDLVASFPDWLAGALRERKVHVLGPKGGVQTIDLSPETVHTVVLWSKDFSNLLSDAYGLKGHLAAYDQIYLHFTVTALGGTSVEPGVPDYRTALAQLPALTTLVGDPLRVSVRFDPLLFWVERGVTRSNLDLFPEVAEAAAAVGIRDIRVSFAQWYGKAVRRAAARGFAFAVPSEDEQRSRALELAAIAAARGLVLHACSQPVLAGIPGLRPSACIDGALLQSLHPRREPVSRRKDRGQRAACLCTESKDIGSYTQTCPHGCVYCYANPKL
ncbi:MAG: DUF1848 family protein [Candidatus Aminicenantales bacterium]